MSVLNENLFTILFVNWVYHRSEITSNLGLRIWNLLDIKKTIKKSKIRLWRYENLVIHSSSCKNSKMQISRYNNFSPFEICLLEIREMFVYKDTEAIEYV